MSRGLLRLQRLPRRLAFVAGWLWAFAVLVGGEVQAGEQQYEPLADSIRTALARSVGARGDARAAFSSARERLDWLTQMSRRLPARSQPSVRERIAFLEVLRYEAQRAGLDPQLVLAVVQVESNFRRYAISHAGARGYMQVMPFWTRLIGNGDPATLFDMRANLRFGCTILRHYLDLERGNLFRALARYNGSLGQGAYPQAVWRAWQRWNWAPSPESGPRARTQDRVVIADGR
ncbi:MAG: lytic transglycosylase domain-containing protein [Burkholderiaceae bacterium]|nr:lytic transglycosylase domain-containing protein [Burkholderiaceae bacterium]